MMPCTTEILDHKAHAETMLYKACRYLTAGQIEKLLCQASKSLTVKQIDTLGSNYGPPNGLNWYCDHLMYDYNQVYRNVDNFENVVAPILKELNRIGYDLVPHPEYEGCSLLKKIEPVEIEE